MTQRAFFGISIPTLVIGFFVGYFVAAPLRGGLARALQPMLTNPSSAVALLAAGVALAVGLIGPSLAFIVNSKQLAVTKTSADAAKTSADAAKASADAAMMNANYAGTRALATVRLKWLEDLRDTLAKYHSILMEPKNEGEDNRELAYLGTRLDLLLNQNKQHQQTLWQVSDDILKMDLKRATENDLQAADKGLVVAARTVLDFHWRKIKAEILGHKPLTEPQYEKPAQSGDSERG